jgi:hypothetical protein
MEVVFTYKSTSTTAKVEFLPREGEEVIMDGVFYHVHLVCHNIDQGKTEVVLVKE